MDVRLTWALEQVGLTKTSAQRLRGEISASLTKLGGAPNPLHIYVHSGFCAPHLTNRLDFLRSLRCTGVFDTANNHRAIKKIKVTDWRGLECLSVQKRPRIAAFQLLWAAVRTNRTARRARHTFLPSPREVSRVVCICELNKSATVVACLRGVIQKFLWRYAHCRTCWAGAHAGCPAFLSQAHVALHRFFGRTFIFVDIVCTGFFA